MLQGNLSCSVGPENTSIKCTDKCPDDPYNTSFSYVCYDTEKEEGLVELTWQLPESNCKSVTIKVLTILDRCKFTRNEVARRSDCKFAVLITATRGNFEPIRNRAPAEKLQAHSEPSYQRETMVSLSTTDPPPVNGKFSQNGDHDHL